MPHSVIDHAHMWLEYALADLAIAQIPLPAESKYELLLFHAQQTVEKSLKAVLTLYEIDFPYTHSLQRLVELTPEPLGQRELLISATVLTEFATITRYPGEIESVANDRYKRLVSISEQVYAWAFDVVKNHEKNLTRRS